MSLRQLELILLGMLVFVLPNLETPKTLFWALYVLVFMIRKHREGDLWHLPRTRISWVLWGMLTANITSTLINWPLDNGIKGAADIIRYMSLFLCIYASDYSRRELRNIALVAITGAVAGLGFGLLEVMNNVTTRLQFHSAGVVTQSAIYLGMIIVLTLGFAMQWRDLKMPVRIVSIFVLSLLGIALFYMGSRGSLLAVAAVLVLVVLANLSWRMALVTITASALIAVISFAIIKAVPQNVLNDGHYERLSIKRFKKSDNERIQAWEIALAQLKTGHTAIIGIGPKNFRSINPADLGIQSSFYERAGVIHHAHNLFLTELVETGSIGLALMLWFFYLVSRHLYHLWRQNRENSLDWTWYAGLGGLVVPVIAGSFNAPFAQENAMLAMILMGMMFKSTSTQT